MPCANCGLSMSEIKNHVLLQSSIGDIEKYGEHFYAWVLEAEKQIGTYNGMHKVLNYKITNDVATTLTPLPDDIYQLLDADFCNQYSYYTGASNNFRTSCNCGCSVANNCSCIKWFVNGCYIQSSRKVEEVNISYLAIPLDDDGFPYVKETHLSAIIAYIKFMLIQGRFDEGKVAMQIYNTRYREWILRCREARSKDEVPNDAELERLANIFNAKLPVHYRNSGNMARDYVLVM